MEYVRLGDGGPLVSRFCLGLLSLSRLQAALPPAEAVALLEAALEAGVTFFDTAELYDTYQLVRQVLPPPAVVATKTYAYTYSDMRASVRRALAETGRGCIDLFLLHEQESRLTLSGHAEALRCLVEAKTAGVVGAVGVSTHAPEVVTAAAEMDEIDVIHPLVNRLGLGLLNGSLDDMLAAIDRAGRAGKGIYAMKILGGGHLGTTREATAEAFAFARGLAAVHAVAVGAKSREELELDIALLSGAPVAPELWDPVARSPRRLLVEEHCSGCGNCVEACRHGALRAPAPGRPVTVDEERCVLCGYCAAACRDFFIKVV